MPIEPYIERTEENKRNIRAALDAGTLPSSIAECFSVNVDVVYKFIQEQWPNEKRAYLKLNDIPPTLMRIVYDDWRNGLTISQLRSKHGMSQRAIYYCFEQVRPTLSNMSPQPPGQKRATASAKRINELKEKIANDQRSEDAKS